MINYQDMYSRYHDKEVLYKEHIPSNNAYIYSSIANHLGLNLDHEKLKICYNKSVVSMVPYKVYRSPYKNSPPLSFDEVVGLSSLNLLNYKALKASYWQYNSNPGKPIPLYKINWFKAVFELYRLKDKHRNEVWINSHLYPNVNILNFRLKPDYTYYLKMLYYNRGIEKSKPSLIHKLYFYMATYISLKSNRTSTKNIRWVMLKDLKMEDSFLYDMIDIKTQIRDYFGNHHIFNLKVQELK